MATASELGHLCATLSEVVPADADIRSIELRRTDAGRSVVTVGTLTPGRLIGRHGMTAAAVRARMAERLGEDDLQLNILEARDQPEA